MTTASQSKDLFRGLYETSSRWSRKVDIDKDFLDVLTSRLTVVPNTRSGRTPSLGEINSGITSTTKKNRLRGHWKATFMITRRSDSRGVLTSGGGGGGGEVRLSSRERRGTMPPGLTIPGAVRERLGLADATSKFQKILSRRRTAPAQSQIQSSQEQVAEDASASPSPTSKSPPAKKSFKDLARQALFEQRVKDCVENGRAASLGDLFMHQLYQEVDKKKINKMRNIAIQQAALMEKRRLLKKFRMAVRITLWCIKTGKRHCVQAQEANELFSFFNMNFAAMDTFQNVDLLFDPSKFKANRMARVSKEMKRIFRKQPCDRTDQELYYAQIALRNIKCFVEFPDRMQRKIAEVGMYEKFGPRRVLLRQGHPASSFYFILSGAVSVLVREDGRAFARVMAHLEKGQSFGELAIITRGKRQSNVVVKEKSEFLTISVDDYHKIFMCGGVKTVNDPDHEMFVRSLPFLQGWPIKMLNEETSKCVFLYFKRGDVIIKDSKYSDWIVVVKSGSVSVMKKLRKVEAFEWRKPKGIVFISDKEKRDRGEQLVKLRKHILPDLNVPLRSDRTHRGEDDEIQEEGRLRPFVHPEGGVLQPPPSPAAEGFSDAKVWDFGSGGQSNEGMESVSYVHMPLEDAGRTQMVDQEVGSGEEGSRIRRLESGGMSADGRPNTVGAISRSASMLPGRRLISRESLVTPERHVPEEEFRSEVRTIQQELEDYGAKKDPDDITAADLNPEFVHVQTLTKGMVFGLSDLIFGQHTNFCVVSNGADVILVNKQMYEENASEGLLRRMRQELCPYPSEEELQTRLQTSVDWDAYRQSTLADTVKSVRMRKQVRV